MASLWDASLSLGLILAVMPVILVILVILYVLYLRLSAIYRRSRIADFHRKRVFITGCDSGFGRELALKLDRKGLVVYAGCYTAEGGRKLKEIVSDRVHILEVDVTKRESLERARDFIENDLPPGEGLWGLVNNAGILRSTSNDLCREPDYQISMDVNFYGPIRGVEVLGPLVRRARGRIVNVTSVMGRLTIGGDAYSCSKHALEEYSDGLRRAMKTFGVHVAVIEPGFYVTNITVKEFWEGEVDRAWNRLPQSVKDEYGEEFHVAARKYLSDLNSNTRSLVRWHNKPSDVPNAMAHALSSTRPKARYLIGLDAHIAVWLDTLMPTCMMDACMRHLMNYDTVATRVGRRS